MLKKLYSRDGKNILYYCEIFVKGKTNLITCYEDNCIEFPMFTIEKSKVGLNMHPSELMQDRADNEGLDYSTIQDINEIMQNFDFYFNMLNQ